MIINLFYALFYYDFEKFCSNLFRVINLSLKTTPESLFLVYIFNCSLVRLIEKLNYKFIYLILGCCLVDEKYFEIKIFLKTIYLFFKRCMQFVILIFFYVYYYFTDPIKLHPDLWEVSVFNYEKIIFYYKHIYDKYIYDKFMVYIYYFYNKYKNKILLGVKFFVFLISIIIVIFCPIWNFKYLINFNLILFYPVILEFTFFLDSKYTFSVKQCIKITYSEVMFNETFLVNLVINLIFIFTNFNLYSLNFIFQHIHHFKIFILNFYTNNLFFLLQNIDENLVYFFNLYWYILVYTLIFFTFFLLSFYLLIKKFYFKIKLYIFSLITVLLFLSIMFFLISPKIRSVNNWKIFSFSINFNYKINLIFGKYEIFNFNFNYFNCLLSFMVLTIYFFIILYTNFYLRKELFFTKFLFFLSMFSISMILLILSNNLIMCFICWELIGISSFFLIGHYSTKISNFKSALKAYFFNKFSDILFILLIITHYKFFGNFFIYSKYLNTNVVYLKIFNYNINLDFIICLLILILCFIKSAQMFFSIWLIDSMDAPVPASSLIHSATLVIAGIIIMQKYKYLFLNNIFVLQLTLIMCSVTSVLSAVSASYQTDLKKLLAHSTINNCSTLILLILLNTEHFMILFCLGHGFIKSFLFLVSGFFFLFNKHKQDFRHFNNLTLKYQYLTWSFYLGIFFLSTFPFLISYDIKHCLFTSSININYYIKLLSFSMISLSSLFSINYGLNFFFNLNFLIYNNKTYKYNDSHLYLNKNKNVYKSLNFIILVYGIFIFIFLIFQTNFFINFFNTNIYSVSVNLSYITNIFYIFFLIIQCVYYFVFFKNSFCHINFFLFFLLLLILLVF